MMDPHTAAELDLDRIWHLVDDLLTAHGTWLPAWARKNEAFWTARADLNSGADTESAAGLRAFFQHQFL